MIYNDDGTPLSKSQPDFYRKISEMRKVKSGGKFFKDKEAARDAQRKSVESRIKAAKERAEIESQIQENVKNA